MVQLNNPVEWFGGKEKSIIVRLTLDVQNLPKPTSSTGSKQITVRHVRQIDISTCQAHIFDVSAELKH